MATEKLYLMHSIKVPKYYVGRQMGSWGEMTDKEHAIPRTKEWWVKNAAPGWEGEFELEEVGDGGSVDSGQPTGA